MYKFPYPHRYGSWESCLISNLLLFGIINAWSAWAEFKHNDDVSLKDVIQQYFPS